MTDSIQFGSKKITFQLFRSERKTLGISVNPEMQVVVKAPNEAEYQTIIKKLRGKAPWILKQQRYFLSFHPRSKPLKYISGETILYLGKQYRLKILKASTESVKLKGAYLIVTTNNESKVKTLVLDWYAKKANIKFNEIAPPLINKFQKYKVEPEALVIRKMKNRWGSCTPKGKIILNPELIQAPKACIEYVIIHELCHLVHHDHTKRFFELQTKEMPSWEKWKEKLEKLLA